MKERNTDKIYTYAVLVVGILIWAFYFYGAHRYAQELLTTSFRNTNYHRYFRRNDFFDNTTTWMLLQVLFLYSWWNLRSCIVSVYKKIHNKI